MTATLRDLIAEARELILPGPGSMWDPAQMAPDTREGLGSRQEQLDTLTTAVEMAMHPPKDDQADTQREFIWDAVFNCTDNEMVARAVSATMRNTGWGYVWVQKAAEARENLNRQRAMMDRMFGNPNPHGIPDGSRGSF